jgi:hypothetical protein
MLSVAWESEDWYADLTGWASSALNLRADDDAVGPLITWQLVRRTPQRIEVVGRVRTGESVRLVETAGPLDFDPSVLTAARPLVAGTESAAEVFRDVYPSEARPARVLSRRGSAEPDGVDFDVLAVRQAVAEWAAIQTGLAPHRLDLQRAGMPVMDPAWYPQFLESQLTAHVARPVGDPLRLESAEADELRARLTPLAAESSAVLAESRLPLALDPVFWESRKPAAGPLSARERGFELSGSASGSAALSIHSLAGAAITHPYSILRGAAMAAGSDPADLSSVLSDYREARAREAAPQERSLGQEDFVGLATHAVRMAPLVEYASLLRFGPDAAEECLDALRSVGTLPAGWIEIRVKPGSRAVPRPAPVKAVPRRARRAL